MKVLALVGTGIKTVSHLTEEAKGYISNCDKVLYLVNEPLLEKYINVIAKEAVSLDSYYFKYQSRAVAYNAIAQQICIEINKVNTLCVVMYGHPCVFASPGLLALSELNKNIKVIVCPAVSAQDCLYADLKFDPGIGGIQSFDATEYLLYDKLIDSSSHLVIYQIGIVGNLGLPTNKVNIEAINFIKKKLISIYEEDKSALIYEAALYPGTSSKIVEFHLRELEQQKLTTISTLYVPPEKTQKTPNSEALKLLNQVT